MSALPTREQAKESEVTILRAIMLDNRSNTRVLTLCTCMYYIRTGLNLILVTRTGTLRLTEAKATYAGHSATSSIVVPEFPIMVTLTLSIGVILLLLFYRTKGLGNKENPYSSEVG